jgi:hypothetical protein
VPARPQQPRDVIQRRPRALLRAPRVVNGELRVVPYKAMAGWS